MTAFWRHKKAITTVLFWVLGIQLINPIKPIKSFNLDTSNVAYGLGPDGSLFGFAVAQHFRHDRPTLLVGAPLAESGQPNTTKAGAVFSCPLEFEKGTSHQATRSTFKKLRCIQLQVEYPTQAEFEAEPSKLNNKVLHHEGKNRQLLGFVVQSVGTKRGGAMVCAPLLRYGTSAYTDGACYLLSTDLNYTGVMSTCNTLPKVSQRESNELS
jgi:hypothetical protein